MATTWTVGEVSRFEGAYFQALKQALIWARYRAISADIAFDAVQEVASDVFRRWETVPEWWQILKCAKRHVQRLIPRAMDPEDVLESIPVRDDSELAETRIAVREWLATLSDGDRSIAIDLMSGLTIREIAEERGRSPNAIFKRIIRYRASLGFILGNQTLSELLRVYKNDPRDIDLVGGANEVGALPSRDPGARGPGEPRVANDCDQGESDDLRRHGPRAAQAGPSVANREIA